MILVWLFERFCMFWGRLKGWKVRSIIPETGVKKAVVIVAPHTSNWDYVYGMGVKIKYKMKATYFAKKELFKFPMKTILEKTGGLPIDRSKKKNMVAQVVDWVNKADEMYIVIEPEGTRKRVDKWKSGFYHIALEAKIPIFLAYIDYDKKEAAIDELYEPTGNKEKDFEYFRNYYSKIAAKHPEKFNTESFL
jgi:1-acyl-sn-glycerol-3-phosphate acyltransferase